jgi:hypothetical protein
MLPGGGCGEMFFDKKTIDGELQQAGGTIEWVSGIGLGISFSPETTDDQIAALSKTIQVAVWISLRNARITERTLSRLNGAPRLEDLDLGNVPLELASIEPFLQATPTIRKVTVSKQLLGAPELERLRTIHPTVQFAES